MEIERKQRSTTGTLCVFATLPSTLIHYLLHKTTFCLVESLEYLARSKKWKCDHPTVGLLACKTLCHAEQWIRHDWEEKVVSWAFRRKRLPEVGLTRLAGPHMAIGSCT